MNQGSCTQIWMRVGCGQVALNMFWLNLIFLLVQYHHLLYYFIAVGFQSIGQVSPKTLKEYPPVNYHS